MNQLCLPPLPPLSSGGPVSAAPGSPILFCLFCKLQDSIPLSPSLSPFSVSGLMIPIYLFIFCAKCRERRGHFLFYLKFLQTSIRTSRSCRSHIGCMVFVSSVPALLLFAFHGIWVTLDYEGYTSILCIASDQNCFLFSTR
ncbi:hypothetical protein H4582DRAFT_1339475 [Lactarius indigo]|nr:hypothetical protein H4582DRAFT_1339475 [Lactarius indigo]